MKYVYSWLKELYPNIPSLDDLPELLIQLGHDVEEIVGQRYDGVIVGQILEVTKHPNADRLSLVKVSTGKDVYDVVCGAPNIAQGLKVPYAPIGTTLPSGMIIKPAKIREVQSNGMLCAEDELGIGANHEGLLILPDNAIPGEPIHKYIAPDAILSLDITPNRGDVLSHFGLARDIKAGHEHQLLRPSLENPNYSGQSSQFVDIEKIHADCDGFHLGYARATSLPKTPLLIQSRLLAVGVKPINIASDITNYVMYEFGQPLHAYDMSKLPEPKQLAVDRARSGESFRGLNGQTYTLEPICLIIRSGDTPVGLAGILGGEATKTSDATTQVVFEAGTFHPRSISLAARTMNLLTDSALRFERGVDPELRTLALTHAQAIWQKLTGGQVYSPIIKTTPKQTKNEQTEIDLAQLNQVFSSRFDREQITQILEALGCTIIMANDTSIIISPPSWRFDLHYVEDYYEEVMRIIGLTNLPKQSLPATVPVWKRSKFWREEYIKDLLVNIGAYEVKTYPFALPDEIKTNELDKAIKLTTAPQAGKDYLRTSLIPGMLQAIAMNPEIPFLALFEIGHVYHKNDESEMLSIAVSSNNSADIDDWWQNLFEKLRLPLSSWMGRLKVIDEETRQRYKIRKSHVSVLQLSPEELQPNKGYDILPVTIPDLDAIEFIPLSKFQASRRDIAFVVDMHFDPETIASEIGELHQYIVDVELFDTFQDAAKLGQNKYSVAFHILYQAPNKTLTAEEINELHKMVETFIKERYHGTIR